MDGYDRRGKHNKPFESSLVSPLSVLLKLVLATPLSPLNMLTSEVQPPSFQICFYTMPFTIKLTDLLPTQNCSLDIFQSDPRDCRIIRKKHTQEK